MKLARSTLLKVRFASLFLATPHPVRRDKTTGACARRSQVRTLPIVAAAAPRLRAKGTATRNERGHCVGAAAVLGYNVVAVAGIGVLVLPISDPRRVQLQESGV